jgi:uncharacterized hydrophobic protein (TIGR00271 family)
VRNPDGDAVQFDVINAQANEVVLELRTLGVDRGGSIVIEDVGTELSDRVTRAEARVPRALNFSPSWEDAEARIRAGGRYPPSWFVLLAIAGLIAAVGIFTNSQILIVAPWSSAPSTRPSSASRSGSTRTIAVGFRSGSGALFFGLLLALVATFVFGLVVRAFGWEPEAFSLGVRPVSDLIDSPNVFSVVVAALAGVVGVVSLVEARTGALIGVFISVTTIPAAADIGVSCAFENWSEARGSLTQLLLNVAILIAVGAAGLVVQQRLWRRVRRRATKDSPQA